MTEPRASSPREISLPIEGMTCASYVNRIERFLRETPGTYRILYTEPGHATAGMVGTLVVGD